MGKWKYKEYWKEWKDQNQRNYKAGSINDNTPICRQNAVLSLLLPIDYCGLRVSFGYNRVSHTNSVTRRLPPSFVRLTRLTTPAHPQAKEGMTMKNWEYWIDWEYWKDWDELKDWK